MAGSDNSIVRHQLTEMKRKVDGSDEFLLHAHAINGALGLTNGDRGDTGKMSDQLAVITAVLIRDRVGETERHRRICPMTPLLGKDKHGNVILPRYEEAVIPPSSAPASVQNVRTMLLTATAQHMKTLIVCTFVTICIVSFLLILSGQVRDAASAGLSVSQAVKDMQTK